MTTKKIATARRRSKGELSRENLLDAAARVFNRYGFQKATIRDVAREAGIALGGLYFHFRSKEEFVAAVLERGTQSIWEHVRSEVQALPARSPPLERLESAIRAHVVASLRHGDYAAAIRHARDSQAPKAIRQRYLHSVDRYRDFWKQLIEDGQRAGALRADVTSGMLLFFLFGAVNWMTEWYEPGRRSIDLLVHDFTVLLTDGMRQRGRS